MASSVYKLAFTSSQQRFYL